MQLMYGGDIVAPPGNQVANSEHKHLPVASGVPSLLDKKSADLQMSMVAGLLPSSIAWISADFDRALTIAWMIQNAQPARSGQDSCAATVELG